MPGRSLEHYQGRGPGGHKPMFGEGFRAGHTRAEDVPMHFVRIGGFSDSHRVGPDQSSPGLLCTGCMSTAARMRQWVEGLWRPSNTEVGHE